MLPPREDCRSRVNFESLYGICLDLPSTSDEMTLPKADSERLILVASLNLSPTKISGGLYYLLSQYL